MLHETIPFRYLTPQERAELARDLMPVTYEAGRVIARQGDMEDRAVYLVEEGTVVLYDMLKAPPERLGTVEAGHYFGERPVLFEEVRSAEARALTPVKLLRMEGPRFLRLIAESVPFAQALGDILRDKQGVFTPFDRFRGELLAGVAEGRIDLRRLLPLYRALEPALHPHAGTARVVDVDALTYAVRRLPDNVTRTFAYYLTETLPALYAEPDGRFRAVETPARRRAAYEMMPGKNMVLLRDGVSDLFDLITCLCLFATEARKLRRLIRDGGGLDTVDDATFDPLRQVWPTGLQDRLTEIALHHEDFRIEIHKELDNYNSAHAERWIQQIAGGTRRLLGTDPADLPADFPVHVISSNTHSVLNCLSPWMGRHAEEVRRWAEAADHPLVREAWTEPRDLVYALARDYFAEDPRHLEEKRSEDAEAGILSLEWTAFTGIAVQLVDTGRLSPAALDPHVGDPAGAPRGLIVNIDYAFGEQAEHIIGSLVSLFGRRVASVNVLGKAGGLQGARGDVLVPTGFVEQSGDAFHPIPGGNAVDANWIAGSLPDRGVHQGNVLTVMGTLLQNRRMLHFNRHIWRCVGLEMEGSFYLRRIRKAMDAGVLAPSVPLRFLYYVSDLPLRHDANLSASLRSREGIPPLYATTRAVLRAVFA